MAVRGFAQESGARAAALQRTVEQVDPVVTVFFGWLGLAVTAVAAIASRHAFVATLIGAIPARGTSHAFTVASKRRPFVPSGYASLLFYTLHEGFLHRLDASTGEDTQLSLENPENRWFRVSPDGRWILLSQDGPNSLLEVATGRTRELAITQTPSAGDYPLIGHASGQASEWTLYGLDVDLTVIPEVEITRLEFVDEERLLGSDDAEGLYLFGLDGRLLRTLREPNTAQPH